MQLADETRKKLRRSRSYPHVMPLTDSTAAQTVEDCVPFPINEIVRCPLPGYVAPSLIAFSPDDSLVTYLCSPDQTLNKKVFAFDLRSRKPELFFSPPDGGLDENNISPEEKLRRERLRERGLGVTRYEWVESSKKKTIMVPLPNGVCSLHFFCPFTDFRIFFSSFCGLGEFSAAQMDDWLSCHCFVPVIIQFSPLRPFFFLSMSRYTSRISLLQLQSSSSQVHHRHQLLSHIFLQMAA